MSSYEADLGVVPPFDAELLRRQPASAPRYTSYPTAPQFNARFGEREFRACAERSNESGGPLSLYVHIPFCTSPCFYCGCNRIITRDAAAAEEYGRYVSRELAALAPLFDARRLIVQLHLGGGTPNFLERAAVAALVDEIARRFRLSGEPERDFSIELDPRFLPQGYVEALAELGFNRASLGVQDFDRAVQLAVNRVQSVEQTLETIEACRAAGFRSINVDLIYGLPRQTLRGFAQTLETLVAARPSRLAIYSYAHLPELFKAQRQIEAADLPDVETKLGLLKLAIETLAAAGYRYIGMDHFALPQDDLARAQASGGLHRNFMGYTTHAECTLLAAGVSAISHVAESYSQNFRDLRGWSAALDAGRLPIWRGLALDFDDVLRAEIIQELMCRGRIEIEAVERRHGIDFAQYFAESLRRLGPLVADELVTVDAERIRLTPRGRLLVRSVAMCFDRYLEPAPAAAEPHRRFSRAI